MKFKDKVMEALFGGAIEAKVKERLKAAAVTDKEEEGWRKLTGDTTRNLSPLKQERMIEIAYWLWQNNPLANWLIEITVDFILAEDLPYEAKHPDVKAAMDDFWFDPLNRMDLRISKYVREHLLYGELCLTRFRAEQTGKIRLGYIDPANIKEVITDPENVQVVIGVVLKSRAGGKERKLKAVLPRGADEILGTAALTLRDSYTDGECYFFSINNVSNSPRGVSEILKVADWLDAYEMFLFDYTEKWALTNTFVWDITVKGGDKDTMTETAKQFTKKSGSAFVHNEKVSLQASAPRLQSYEANSGAKLFRNHILGAMGFPEHWFGGGGDVNLATAVEMGTPAFKMLKARQLYVKFILESIFEDVIESRRQAGTLKVTDEEAGDFSVITPELGTKDATKYAAVVQQVTTALVQARTQGWVDDETAQKIFALTVGHLGIEIDLGDMAEKLKSEKDKKGYEDYE